MDTILNNLDTGIKIALLGVLTGPIVLLVLKLFGKIISEQKVIRDTKMVDLEVNGLIYSLNVVAHVASSILIFCLLDHFKLIGHLVGTIGIAVFLIISAFLFIGLLSIPIGGFNKLQKVLNESLSEAAKKDGEKIDKNFFNDIVSGFNDILRFVRNSIYYLNLVSFLNFLSCLVIVKSFGVYWGSIFIVFCLSNVVIISCISSYKNGEKAVCDIYLEQGVILEGVVVKCINDSDIYILDDNEVRIINKSKISEIRIKKIDKNINSIKSGEI